MPRSLDIFGRSARTLALVLTSALLSACALLAGIDTDLDVKPVADDASDSTFDRVAPPSDAGDDRTMDADAAVLRPPRLPAAGSYVYTVSGSDKLNGPFPSPQAKYGPTATVTIAHVSADCYDMTFTFRTDYEETMRMCVVGLELVQDRGVRKQKFNVGAASTTTTCKAPGDVYFTTAPTPPPKTHDCSGENTDDQSGASAFRTLGPYTFVGDETIPIMGKPTATRRFHDDRVVSGKQDGTNVGEWYFTVEDNVVARLERAVVIDYPTAFGKVTYVENVSMTLSERPPP